MIETWFTSDHHFGHKNILEYEKEARPFSTLKEMHEVLIERWNSVVNSGDIVCHLGDFCFGRNNIEIASRLKGKKRLVMGNHDVYPADLYLRHFEKLHGIIFWRRCVLSHHPIHPSTLGSRWFLSVHGHLHSKRVVYSNTTLEDRSYLNVSIEQNNLTPIHADIIMERLKEIE